MGYAGGTSSAPTYHDLDGHSESVLVRYDPSVISYDTLLNIFWESHAPFWPAFSRQYASVLFVSDERQKECAMLSKARTEKEAERVLFTEILPRPAFYPAEAYHQKYFLRSTSPLFEFFAPLYPDTEEFRAAPTIMRVNAYLGGGRDPQRIETDPEILVLPAAIRELLRKIVSAT